MQMSLPCTQNGGSGQKYSIYKHIVQRWTLYMYITPEYTVI